MSNLTKAERRKLVHLLDLLCEYEESVVDCATVGGELDRRDALQSAIALRSRRIWRSAQALMIKLEGADGR